MPMNTLPTLHDYARRVFQRTVIEPGPLDTPCWVWQGAVNSAGYGVICIRLAPRERRVVTVHRFVYRYSTLQPIPEGYVIGHKCDVKLCCNMAHLDAVTEGQNLRDAWARDRRARVFTRGDSGRFA